MILAVMSYPRHYHISQLAIRHAIKHIPDITEIAVIWDDTQAVQPNIPLHSSVRSKIPCYTYPWSAVIQDSRYPINGWIGQQLIKLHIDRVIKDECVILDGDLIINQDIDPANITYANALPRHHSKYRHINEMLGLGVYDFGSCPFMYVRTSWLKDIRRLTELHSHTDVIEKFNTAIRDNSNHPNWLNEWELIATYALQVLKLPRRVEYFNRRAVKTQAFAATYNDQESFVLDGPDDIGREFYESKEIHIDRQLISALGYNNC